MKILNKVTESDNNLSSISTKLSLNSGPGFKMISGSQVNSLMKSAKSMIDELQYDDHDINDKRKSHIIGQVLDYVDKGREAISDTIKDANMLIEGCKEALQLLEDIENQIEAIKRK